MPRTPLQHLIKEPWIIFGAPNCGNPGVVGAVSSGNPWSSDASKEPFGARWRTWIDFDKLPGFSRVVEFRSLGFWVYLVKFGG